MRNTLITGLLALIALIPAVVIYSLFPDNSASVTTGGQALKFGGPIAAFIGTFMVLAHFYNKQAIKSPELPVLVREKIVPLAGVWTISSESDGTSAIRVSTVTISAVATGIELTGGSFEEPQAAGKPAKLVGQWNCDIAFFNGHRLLYVYDLDDTKPQKERHRGIVDAQLVGGANPPCFKGTWETLGGGGHSGRITLTKLPG